MGTAGTKGVPRADRESQILDIAGRQIEQVGYAGMSPALVAEAAGVSKPMVYHYFGSKDGLYVACVEQAAEVVCGAIETVFDRPAQWEMIERTLEAIFRALAGRQFHWNVLLDATHPAEGPAATAAWVARSRLAGQAARGAEATLGSRGMHDPVDLSAFTEVWMAAVAALVNWWVRHPDETAEAMIARSHRLFAVLFLGSGTKR
ncbi:TetR/AcrR family transcriptional regulator [Mycobacteroides immunogenum]|uniref:TetR family transcriptional regulator n=1 Tax=Mycobacteroides immunogenum TaxID=83262 RepID=A0A7V8RVF4_9MYCO|nr:TetR/AcrR family transcriptional regulator [Mycobacteroides immunogenum]AMT72694.1 TetR family transcriptional regulator [Mycobacteroides immunogenum]ANO05855.1 TetR family transcriptional regulator [Mycobacteroides immunogenum]KIU40990.1 TetR family transcriptional regulator [Mycobacteroides immunogenum]KPG05893.1 TetR family transcriptional regulator [Mycobacteroides immunogenum]KPG07539.1 TetR family transcriptional regulator [Mycobacteroides immunogenum]